MRALFAAVVLVAWVAFSSSAHAQITWGAPRDFNCNATFAGMYHDICGLPTSGRVLQIVQSSCASGVGGGGPGATRARCSTNTSLNNVCNPSHAHFDAALCNANGSSPQCPAGQIWNGSQCIVDEPCDSVDAAAARAAVDDTNSIPPTTSIATASPGFNTIQESTSTDYACSNTCLIGTTITVKVGAVTGNQYEVIDETRSFFVGGPCDNPPQPTSSTRTVNIGYNGNGTGCAAGYSWGGFNGQIGCHYHGTSPGGNPQQSTTTTTSTSTSTTTGEGGGGSSTTTTTGTSTSTTTTTGGVAGHGTNGSGIGCDPTSGDYIECIAPQGELPDHTEGEADDFGEAVSNFATALGETGVGSMASNLANIFPSGGGTCPVPTFTVPYMGTLQIDMHCTLFSEISGMLSAIMLVLWSIVGIRIIVSA